jgi:hypothetical protein
VARAAGLSGRRARAQDPSCETLCNYLPPPPPPPPFKLSTAAIALISVGCVLVACIAGYATRAIVRIYSRRREAQRQAAPPPRQRAPSCSGKLPAFGGSTSATKSPAADDKRHDVIQSL